MILAGYEPEAGDHFLLFETGTHSLEHPINGMIDFDEGLIQYGDGFEMKFSAAPLADGLWWEYSATGAELSLTVVPEPSTIAVLAVGALAAVKRRRNR